MIFSPCVRSASTCGERAPSSNQRSASHSQKASKSSPAKTSRHCRPFVSNASRSLPARSHCTTWLAVRRPRPMPTCFSLSRNTGKTAPCGPCHRWRGLTVSPVGVRRFHSVPKAEPRTHAPFPGAKPQTRSSTKATNVEVSALPDIRAEVCRRSSSSWCRPSAGGARRATTSNRGASSRSPPWRRRSQPASDIVLIEHLLVGGLQWRSGRPAPDPTWNGALAARTSGYVHARD